MSRKRRALGRLSSVYILTLIFVEIHVCFANKFINFCLKNQNISNKNSNKKYPVVPIKILSGMLLS